MSVKVLVSGGFDPLHEGHLDFLEQASKLGELTVAVNSDEYVIQKKGACLLPRVTRAKIISDLKYVSCVLSTWSDKHGTANEAIRLFYSRCSPQSTLIFANGGDVTPSHSSISEFQYCASLNIIVAYGVGGNKKNSSSHLLKDYIQNQH